MFYLKTIKKKQKKRLRDNEKYENKKNEKKIIRIRGKKDFKILSSDKRPMLFYVFILSKILRVFFKC